MGTAYKAWRPNWQPYYDLVETGVNRMCNPPLWAGAPGGLMRHFSVVKAAAVARAREMGELPEGLAKADLDAPASDAVEVVAAYFANMRRPTHGARAWIPMSLFCSRM